MTKRLTYIFCTLFCAMMLHAEVFAPINKLSDLRNGDDVVVAIQNGRNMYIWYAVNDNTQYTQNVTTVNVINSILYSPPVSTVWKLSSTTPVTQFMNGSGQYMLNNSSGWSVQQWGTSNRFLFSSAQSSHDTLIWRSDKFGHGIDYFMLSHGDRFIFDQVNISKSLTTGAAAFTLFKKMPYAQFETGEYGWLSSGDTIKIPSFDSYKITLPVCMENSSSQHFLGWALSPGKSIPDFVSGDTYIVNEDIKFYAVYEAVEVPNQCFDFSNLNASYVKCYAGFQKDSFLRYEVRGQRDVIMEDYVWEEGVFTGEDLSSYDVHINVISDTSKTCAILSDVVKEIPNGFSKSVRLGNFQKGLQVDGIYLGSYAEAVQYTFTVDTTYGQILLFKYLPILEDSHIGGSGVQFEILDEKGKAIDPACTFFDFRLDGAGTDSIMGTMPGNPQWKTSALNPNYTAYSGGPFQYHDWATLGLDLSNYHGQTIVLKMFLHDCLLTGHFGCLYYALQCQKKRLNIYSCGAGDVLELEAPEGFFYRWYSASKPTEYFSNDRTVLITQSSQDSLYYCDLSVKSDFSCGFTLSVDVKPRHPKARFEYDIHRGYCADTVYLRNTSFASPDGINEFFPHQDCDGALWDFAGAKAPDGSIPDNTLYDPVTPIVFTESGDYTITLKTYLKNWACAQDQTSQTIHITAGNEYQVTYDSICLGDSIIFRGNVLKPTRIGDNTYINTYKNVGCLTEVTVEEHVFVHQKYEFVEYDTLCPLEVLNWRGKILDKAGTYYDSLYTLKAGCDSVYIMHLHYWPRRDSTYFHEEICDGETYWWNNVGYYQTGQYTQTFNNVYGCDSIVTLDLYVREKYGTNYVSPGFWQEPYWSRVLDPEDWDDPYLSDTITYILNDPEDWDDPYMALPCDRDTICEGDDFVWHGRTFTQTGVYSDTMTTIYGCDSIVFLYLVVYPTYEFEETKVIWEGESYTWLTHHHDTVISDAGVYFDSLKTIYDCDSVYILNLIVNTKNEVTIFDTVCASKGKNWHFFERDTIYYEAGVYTDTLLSSLLEDSIVHLILSVIPDIYGPVFDTAICLGDSLLWNTKYYYTPGLYADTLVSVMQCDSIVYLNLSQYQLDTIHIADTICSGQFYLWGQDTLKTSVIDTIIYTNKFGCDSVCILNLVVQPVSHSYQADTICLGDSLFFFGTYIKEEGEYTKTLTSVLTFCDSIVHMSLHIKKLNIEVFDTICPEDTCFWEDSIYLHAGTYSKQFVSQDGCDSIRTLNLFVLPDCSCITTYDTIIDTICEGDVYMWHGVQLKSSIDTIDTITNSNGCDSICYLSLFVRNIVYTDDSLIICDSGLPYSWHGRILQEEGIYKDTMSNSFGCDSIIIFKLITVSSNMGDTMASICADNLPFIWHGIEADDGTQIHLTNIAGCDSVVTLHLTVLNSSSTMQIDSICIGDTYIWLGKEYKVPGIYRDTIPNAVGCDSIRILDLRLKNICNPCPPTPVQSTHVVKVSPDDLPYVWNGHNLSNDTVITEKFTIPPYGCDSLSILYLYIKEPCELPTKILNMNAFSW